MILISPKGATTDMDMVTFDTDRALLY
jgi:hypothetical protein